MRTDSFIQGSLTSFNMPTSEKYQLIDRFIKASLAHVILVRLSAVGVNHTFFDKKICVYSDSTLRLFVKRPNSIADHNLRLMPEDKLLNFL